MSQDTQITWCDTLIDVSWPDDAVVIADAALPTSLLQQLPNPLLVDAGESLKTLASIGQVAERVLERHATRPMTIIAVGGGSIGDAIGFLASILWRGVSLWHIPTTLVAMVDSAHGGKTAMNLGTAKNQLGTFYPAERVVISRDVLETLPITQRREGLAELLKALWLGDAEALPLWEMEGGAEALAHAPFSQVADRLWTLLRRAVEVKLDVVARDPRETLGIRTTLNLGHTAAHALELEMGLSHGAAVAWGMAACLGISQELEGLEDVAPMLAQVEPLLTPLQGLTYRLSRERFCALLARDKKRINGRLRSVLVRSPGKAVVTTEVTPERWFDALLDTERRWRTQTRTLQHTAHKDTTTLHVQSSKSEMNRALMIAALRPGPTTVDGWSQADDVVWMERVVNALGQDGDVEVYCGQGGTTLRFALALATTRPGRTRLLANARLMERPHDVLLQALGSLGAQITRTPEGFDVVGLQKTHEAHRASVRVDASSQYASAVALLATSGMSLTLRLETDDSGAYAPEHVASRSYLEMTLSMLKDAGVDVSWEGAHVVLTPTPALHDAHTVCAHPDESSAAVWHVARHLGVEVQVAGLATQSRQADQALQGFLQHLAQHPGEDVSLDMRDCPDLVPVFSVAAIRHAGAVDITGVEHLRLKESNRIEDLVRAYERVGVTIEARPDGIWVPSGTQSPTSDTCWPTFEDHRLAMTGALVAMFAASLRMEEPYVVTKSYPDFWSDARRLGWSLR